MFRPLALWSQTPCPAVQARGNCSIPHCLFSHKLPPPPPPPPPPPQAPAPTATAAPPSILSPLSAQKPAIVTANPKRTASDDRLRSIVVAAVSGEDDKTRSKRRKLAGNAIGTASGSSESSGGFSQMMDSGLTAEASNGAEGRATKSTRTRVETGGSTAPIKSSLKRPSSATGVKPMGTNSTPVPTAGTTSNKRPFGSLSSKTSSPRQPTVSGPGQASPPGELTLNPRLIPRSPATYATRLQLLTLLHGEYSRLYGTKADAQKIIAMALDEEEMMAREKKALYTQILKKRIIKLKKQSVDAFMKELAEKKKEEVEKDKEQKLDGKIVVSDDTDNTKPPLDTGLSVQEELNALKGLVHSETLLQKYDFVVTPPTHAEIAAAERGVQASEGWETCDRCKSRFQVFLGRRESDGSLAGGGKCVHHWGRANWPERTHGDYTQSSSEKIFTCCGQPIGQSSGCTTVETHVFKVSEPKRLAAITQFVATPPPPSPPSPHNPCASPEDDEQKPLLVDRAICLDCEMCYTTLGMELVRLTATAFPSGAVVIDALVRPKGEVLDLNSRFSGVTPPQFFGAPPYTPKPYPPTSTIPLNPTAPSSSSPPQKLGILPSPIAARDLLFKYINSTTPLIGHALENDLNALRITHSSIIDTSIIFPHKHGYPMRNRLKYLVERFLSRKIQIEGDPEGHDSAVDARCAGELVRWKIRDNFERERMVAERGGRGGWRGCFKDGKGEVKESIKEVEKGG